MNHAIFDSLSPAQLTLAQSQCQLLELAPGQRVFGAGDHCQGLPVVLAGSIKVQMIGASGNGIVLYRMGQNDMCTLSIGCLMTGLGYRAEAIVEEASRALLVPRPLFERMMAESIDFRYQVLASYGKRLDDLMLLVEEVAFQRMDQRLEEWLQHHGANGCILITHQQLAVELGTAREVVSRLLKELERQGRLKLGRGKIELLTTP
ncbi:Crp/Fnr family transcriptional regulator [Oceanisphaera sediminis]|uniref:Crp/Fnr family transcriptional regulator n=1 Tax=Oceanisphaera sediminis TaxID=981381 RepID=A0ABP7DUT9_9GAMM